MQKKLLPPIVGGRRNFSFFLFFSIFSIGISYSTKKGMPLIYKRPDIWKLSDPDWKRLGGDIGYIKRESEGIE